jgi:branched-chain amino acid transport system ATP-binding protein
LASEAKIETNITASNSNQETLLRVEKLSVAYGDVQVLWEVDLHILPGEIVALVGSNGAGKSTLLSAISGLLKPLCGEIYFANQALTHASTMDIVNRGIAHVPEGRRLFGALSVRENLLLGAYHRRDKPQIKSDLDYILSLFPRLHGRINALAGTLSGGEQQMVAIGRGLMSRPKLLMIDELSLGLAPVIVENLIESLTQINQAGTTILIVEQDVQTALEQATRGYVLETGVMAVHGLAQDLLQDERVRQAYLGL